MATQHTVDEAEIRARMDRVAEPSAPLGTSRSDTSVPTAVRPGCRCTAVDVPRAPLRIRVAKSPLCQGSTAPLVVLELEFLLGFDE